jgi:hypothetical protein
MYRQTNITRRHFIRIGSALAGGTLISPILSSCGAAVAPAGNAVAQTVGKTVGQYFLDFAVGVGSEIVANTFQDWLNSLRGNQKTEVAQLQQDMTNAGFIYANSPVYRINNAYIYNVTFKDNFNGCMANWTPYRPAVVYNNMPAVLYEGPVVIGLALACQDWKSSVGGKSGVSVANGLLPIREFRHGPTDIKQTGTETAGFQTAEGVFEISYHYAPPSNGSEEGTGTISVVGSRPNGGNLFGRDYTIKVG